MRIGLMLQEPSGPDPLAALGENLKRAADEGFASAWMSHILGLDALTALAVVGARVPGIELGTAVVPTYPRHPAALAQQAMTVNAAVDGRLALGIGVSHKIVIDDLLGLDYGRPARHMREYLSVLLPLLRAGGVSFTGETMRTSVAISAPRVGELPVLIAALGPHMLHLAGSVADGTVLWMTGPKTIADHIVPSITAAATAAGRPEPRVVCALPVCVTDDPDAAKSRARDLFAMYGTLPAYQAMLEREQAAGPADLAIVGDEDAVAAQVAALGKAGVTDFAAVEFVRGDAAARTRRLLTSLI